MGVPDEQEYGDGEYSVWVLAVVLRQTFAWHILRFHYRDSVGETQTGIRIPFKQVESYSILDMPPKPLKPLYPEIQENKSMKILTL